MSRVPDGGQYHFHVLSDESYKSILSCLRAHGIAVQSEVFVMQEAGRKVASAYLGRAHFGYDGAIRICLDGQLNPSLPGLGICRLLCSPASPSR